MASGCYDDAVAIAPGSGASIDLQNAYDNTTAGDIDIILNGQSANNGIIVLNYVGNVGGNDHLLRLSETNGGAGLTATELNPNTPFFEVMPRNISGMSAQIDRTNSNQLVLGLGATSDGNDIVALGRANTATAVDDTYMIGRGNSALGGSDIVVLGRNNLLPALNPDASAIIGLSVLGSDLDLTGVNSPDSFRVDERLYVPKDRGLMVLGNAVGAPLFVSPPGVTGTSPVGNATRIPFAGQVNGVQDPLVIHTLQMPLGRMYGGTIHAVGFGDGAINEVAFFHSVEFSVIRDAGGTRVVMFPVVTEVSDVPGTSVLPVVSGTNIDIEIAGIVGTGATNINWSGWIDITEMSR